MRKKTIKLGSYVKVIESKFVRRVGYPLVWTDIVDEVEKDPRTLQAWAIISQQSTTTQETPLQGLVLPPYKKIKPSSEFLKAVAMARVEEMGFGGRERQLIYYKTVNEQAGMFWSSLDGKEIADYTGQVFEVIGKRIAKTGTYYPPSSGYSDEDWYEPGGLDNMKTHVLLDTSAGLIEDINVELAAKPERRQLSAIKAMLGSSIKRC